jgi:hypothetical protein
MEYSKYQFVWISPKAIILAKPEYDTWWIEFFAGDMNEAFRVMPFWLPKVAFARKGKHKIYWTVTLTRRINASQLEDGFADEMSWRRWISAKTTQTSPAARPNHSSGERSQEQHPTTST